jgi:hypothetical protein
MPTTQAETVAEITAVTTAEITRGNLTDFRNEISPETRISSETETSSETSRETKETNNVSRVNCQTNPTGRYQLE